MSKNTRSKNSVINFSIGIFSQVITIVGSFIVRTIFINKLGPQYLGVNGLFTNILMVLSLAELGLGNVLLFNLYKPLAENDIASIKSILSFYKKIYKIISFVIFSLGLLLIPFLNLIINSKFSYQQIIVFYMFFLTNSTITYLVADKVSLINADQKMYAIKLINTLMTLMKDVLQIIVLVLTSNFIIYLFIMLLTSILNNIFISRKVNKMYPYLKEKSTFEVNLDIKEIISDVKSMFLYKIGVVITNNTDNILISIIVGTVYVGYYSNYALIISTVSAFIGILIQSVYSSIGNLNSGNEKQKSYEFFSSLVLFFHWLTSFFSISFLLVFNDFITLWIGSEYILSSMTVFAIVINFHIQNIINPVWIYRETFGLFKQIKHLMIWLAIINLILSIVLGMKYGIVGIIISTAIARALTTVWYEPYILYTNKFDKPVRLYWVRFWKYSCTFILALIVSLISVNLLNLKLNLLSIFSKVFLSFIITNVSFLLVNYKSEEFNDLKKTGIVALKNSFLKRRNT